MLHRYTFSWKMLKSIKSELIFEVVTRKRRELWFSIRLLSVSLSTLIRSSPETFRIETETNLAWGPRGLSWVETEDPLEWTATSLLSGTYTTSLRVSLLLPVLSVNVIMPLPLAISALPTTLLLVRLNWDTRDNYGNFLWTEWSMHLRWSRLGNLVDH